MNYLRGLFLICFITCTFAQQFIGGVVRPFNSDGSIWGLTTDASNSAYVSNPLNILERPTAIASAWISAANFANWWHLNTNAYPNNAFPYAMKFVSSGGSAVFDATEFRPSSYSNLWTVELTAKIFSPTTSTPTLSILFPGEVFFFVNGTLRAALSKYSFSASTPANALSDTITLPGGTTTRVHIFLVKRGYPNTVYPLRITLPDNIIGDADCEIAHAKSPVSNIYPFVNTSYSFYLGLTSVLSGNLRASPASALSGVATWAKEPVRMFNGFRAYFTFNIANFAYGNFEGFAFVIQTNSLTAVPGFGERLGYDGLPRSLAIEFDTSVNSGWDLSSYANPGHIEVHTLFQNPNSANVSRAIVGTGVSLNIAANTEYAVIVEYRPGAGPSAGRGLINVWFGATATVATMPLPTTNPTLSVSIDDSLFRGILNSDWAWVGFTSGSNNNFAANLDIRELRVWSTPIAAVRTSVTTTTSWNSVTVSASQPSSAQLTLGLNDVCGRKISLPADNTELVATLTADAAAIANQAVGSTAVASSSFDYNVNYWHRVAEVTRLRFFVWGVSTKTQDVTGFDLITFLPSAIWAANSRYAQIAPPSPSFASCTTNNPCLISAGASITVNVTTYDAFGNLNTAALASNQITATCSDAIFTLTSSNPPNYILTGTVTQATDDAIRIKINGNDVGTAVSLAIPPSRTTNNSATPTPISIVRITPALPPNPSRTAQTVGGTGYTSPPVAGRNGIITLYPIDDYGNIIGGSLFSGLALPTFNITCVDPTIPACALNAWASNYRVTTGTSQGVSVWQLQYNTTLAATYNLAINLASPVGAVLKDFATITIGPSNTSGFESTFFTTTYTADVEGRVDFQPEDIYGNTIRTQPVGNFQIAITGPNNVATFSCNGVTGTPTTDVQAPRCSYNTQTFLFNIFFVPTRRDTYTVRATWQGFNGGFNQTTVAVGPGEPSGPQSTCSGIPGQVIAGTRFNFTCSIFDAFGNSRAGQDDAAAILTIFNLRPGQGIARGLVNYPTEIQGVTNTYLLGLRSDTKGNHSIQIQVSLGNVPISPTSIIVIPSYGNASVSSATGTGVTTAVGTDLGNPSPKVNTITWRSIDNFQNQLNSVNDTIRARVIAQANTPSYTGGALATISNNGPGLYTIGYIAPAPNGADDKITIEVNLTSWDPATQTTVFTRRLISNIPLVSDGTANNAVIYYGSSFNSLLGVCLPNCTSGCTGCIPRILSHSVAGVASGFNLVDRTGTETTPPYQIYNLVRSSTFSFSISFVHSDGVTEVNIRTDTVTQNQLYSATFTLGKAGNYSVKVLDGAVESAESTNGISIWNFPGLIGETSCVVSGFEGTPSVEAGRPFNYTVQLVDVAGNLIDSTARPAPNSYSFALTAFFGGTSITSSIQSILPATTITDTNNDGILEVSFVPTRAVQTSIGTVRNSVALGGRTFALRVLPSYADAVQSCIGATGSPGSCTKLTTAKAGNPYTLNVFVYDRFQNPVAASGITFAVDLELNGAMTITSTQSLGNGRFSLTFTPQRRIVYTETGRGNMVNVTINQSGYGNGPVTLSSFLEIDPAAISSAQSFFENLPTSTVAGTQLVWQLNLRDQFDNPWFDEPADFNIAVDGPAIDTLRLSTGTSDGISPSPNPGARFTLRFTPVVASEVASKNYTFSIKYLRDGSTYTANNSASVLVFAGPPEANKTSYSVLNQRNIAAGDVYTSTILLRDRFNNIIPRDTYSVMVTFLDFDGVSPICDVNNNVIVVNRTTTAPFITPIVSYPNGTYSFRINGTRAGRYIAYLQVQDPEGDEVRPCITQSDMIFLIVPGPIHPPSCILSGPAITKPTNVRAGSTIEFDVVINDRFGNPVCFFCTGNCDAASECLAPLRRAPLLGPWSSAPGGIYPSNNPTICQTPADPSKWLTNGTFDFAVSPLWKQRVLPDPDASTYRYSFTATKAETWNVVVVLDLTTAVGYQLVGSECYDITIFPSWVYRFNVTRSDNNIAGQNAVANIDATDFYNNVVNGINGPHYWKVTYTYSTNPYVLNPYQVITSSMYEGSFDQHVARAPLFWAGKYTVSVEIVNNPITPESGTASGEISVLAATCAQRAGAGSKFSCGYSGSCTSSYSGCATSQAYTCSGNTTNSCVLQSGTPSVAWCVFDGSDCPNSASDSDVFPAGVTQNACGGIWRATAADCPTVTSCPAGLNLCPNKVTCVVSLSECAQSYVNCPDGTYQCLDGRCVSSHVDCPTPVTCATGSVRCPDGSCRLNADACPPLFACPDSTPFRCPDGACRAALKDCPTVPTCPPGWLLCDSGHCVMSVAQCDQQTCNPEDVRCPDGSCRPTFDLCGTCVTCPQSAPVKCPNHVCAASVAFCAAPPTRPIAEWVQCPRGFFAPNFASCPNSPICPPQAPVLCPNLRCSASVDQCQEATPCPAWKPYRCAFGTCARNFTECATPVSCGSTAPIRCASGGCVPSYQMCPESSTVNQCPDGFISCPSGGCALGLGECPTPITCPWNYTRCGDGSCRTSCVGVYRRMVVNSAGYSDFSFSEVECPDHETGFARAPNYTNCPVAPTCPPERPIRCVDRTCVAIIDHCPPAPEYVRVSGTVRTCPGNTWLDRDTLNCGSSTTCPPALPVKCWDETCRLTARDCPPQPKCVLDSNNALELNPYLCSSGACVTALSQCSPPSACPRGYIKCPGVVSSLRCVRDIGLCGDITNPTLTSFTTCPDSRKKCRDGSCQTDCPTNDCPHHLPYECPDGVCVRRASECVGQTSRQCPTGTTRCQEGICAPAGSNCSAVSSCPNGYQVCADGSCSPSCSGLTANTCRTNLTRCFDNYCEREVGDCKSSSAGFNTCPISRPFRCANGYCALSSAYCPTYSYSGVCAPGKPIRCANGQCVANSIQCPLIRPCTCTRTSCQYRCSDGVCRASVDNCPRAFNICPSERPFMCQNGLCAESSATCINDMTGCPTNWTKCADGTCTDGACTPSLHASNGCLRTSSYKCWNGECAVNAGGCPAVPKGCNYADPLSPACARLTTACPTAGQVRCPDGLCYSSVSQCKTYLGCPLTTPHRCADGTCKKYPADHPTSNPSLNAAERCPSRVVCPPQFPFLCADGQCVANAKLCPAFWPCPAGQVRCNDGSCALDSATCRSQPCPAGSPTLCPNGACVRSYRECGGGFGPTCPDSAPFKCYDGSCAASPRSCVAITLAVKNLPATTIDTSVCNTTENLCWNGACYPRENTIYCPPVPACPNSMPYRCSDGTCVNRVAGGSCSAAPACTGGRICEDGVCRRTCAAYYGCPLSAPLQCSRRAQYCFSSSNAASDNSTCFGTDQEVCSDNCHRNSATAAQIVSVPSSADVLVDVSISDVSKPELWLEIPAGALGGSTNLRITPATQSERSSRSYVLQNKIAVTKSWAQAVLGPMFRCSIDPIPGVPNLAGNPVGTFALNVTVYANTDRESYAKKSATAAVTTPCVWIGGFTSNLVVQSACDGEVTFGSTNIVVSQPSKLGTSCNDTSFSGNLFSVTPISTEFNGYELVYNVTSVPSTADPVLNITTRKSVCVVVTGVGTVAPRITLNPGNPSVCADLNSYNPSYRYALIPKPNPDACSEAETSKIRALDVCFGSWDATGEFRCFAGYYERTLTDELGGFQTWTAKSGRRFHVMRGRLQSCSPNNIYGFWNVPLPPQPVFVAPAKSLWEKYGAIALGVSISVFVVLLVVGYVLWRLFRYRGKYKEEKREAEALKVEAAEMAENWGGFGIAGDDIVMVANPLVLQLEEQKRKLDEVNRNLDSKEESDRVEMDRLDKERQIILDEMRRIQQLLETEKAKKKAQRVDDAPPVSGSRPVAAAAGPAQDWGGSGDSGQQEFAPQPTGAKPRKKDF